MTTDTTEQESPALDPSARPRHAATIADVEVDGEAVLYDPGTRAVHVLNPSATVIWRCLDGEVSLGELAEEIADVHGIDAAAVLADVLAAASSLQEHGLVEA